MFSGRTVMDLLIKGTTGESEHVGLGEKNQPSRTPVKEF